MVGGWLDRGGCLAGQINPFLEKSYFFGQVGWVGRQARWVGGGEKFRLKLYQTSLTGAGTELGNNK